jgi:hypothetical protein
MEYYNIPIPNKIKIRAILQLTFNGKIKKAREIKIDYPLSEKEKGKVKSSVENCLINKYSSWLIGIVKIFKLQKPGNDDMVPQEFFKRDYLEYFMKMIHIIPKDKDDILWSDKIYRIRSANFAYNVIMDIRVFKRSWGKNFKWGVRLFSPVMNHIQMDEKCKSNEWIPCLISIALSRQTLKYFELLMNAMNLGEETIVKHCPCGIYYDGCDSERINVNHIRDNACKLGLNNVVKKVDDLMLKKSVIEKKDQYQ